MKERSTFCKALFLYALFCSEVSNGFTKRNRYPILRTMSKNRLTEAAIRENLKLQTSEFEAGEETKLGSLRIVVIVGETKNARIVIRKRNPMENTTCKVDQNIQIL